MNGKSSDSDAIPLAIEPRMKWFVNNQRFSDVAFVVGEGKEMVYAHKNMIASGSPVFERMFFANHNLQMTGTEPIEIPDLTATGFINMLQYIYTNELRDLDLSELFETFVAGDKYQVYNMNDAMISFIKATLNASNCFIIYDQLMKFPSEYVCVPLGQVKELIRYNSKSAFQDAHFGNISLETLVDVLSMDALTIDEIHVLRSCAKWVDEQIRRLNLESNASNKQEIFKPIKSLIRFSKITFDQLQNFSPIKDLLSCDELNSLFLHYLNVSEFTTECRTTRKKLTLNSASCNNNSNYGYNSHQYFSEISQVFKASRDVLIVRICTFLPTSFPDLELSILDNVTGVKLELNYEKLSDGFWNFEFNDFVTIDAAKEYKFVFKFGSSGIYGSSLSTATAMTVSDGSLQCNFSSFTNGYHCLKKIDFYQAS